VSFLETERLSGRRQSTLVRRRASLRRFAAYLVDQGLLEAGTFGPTTKLIEAPMIEAETLPKSQSLSDGELGKLWIALESSKRPHAKRDMAILALLLETGLSVGTLVALDLDDIELHEGSLRLRLDGGQEVWLLPGKASELIQRYILEARPELNHAPGEPALFISQTGERMSRQGVWQVLRRWGRVTELPITLSPRLARHTAVIDLVQAGRPIDEIQAMLGHSNPLSTQALLRRLGVG
jgi:integrase/recombinase XerD